MNSKEIKPIVHIVCHTDERAPTIQAICEGWLNNSPLYPIELVLSDCTPNGMTIDLGHQLNTDPRFTYCRFNPDPGNKIRHAIALAFPGDPVIQADDDVMPLPGFVNELVKWHLEKPNAFLGIIGRTFQGDTYYGQTTHFAASRITEPVRVGFVGVVYITNRKFLCYDMSGCENPVNDLYWQMKCFPHSEKWVIPVTRYENLRTSRHGLFQDPQARIVRQEFYKKYYDEYYQGREY